VSRRRRSPWAAALLVAPALAVTTPAHAQPDCPPGQAEYDEQGNLRTCFRSGGDGGGDESSDDQPRRIDWTPPPGYVLSEWSTGSSEEDGTPCIRRHRQWEHEDEAAARIRGRSLAFFHWYENHTMDGSVVEHCEDQPPDEGLPAEMVLETIEAQLPLPEPQIAPGWALTGMPAYLEVGAPATFSATVDGATLPVTVEFDATATYRVEWGDGHVSEHASSGGPWPEGDIVHTYADAVGRTVVVTPIWSVTATGAGQTFTFPEVALVSSELELPVREMQSVRTTGR
jgi:hypothetical protein